MRMHIGKAVGKHSWDLTRPGFQHLSLQAVAAGSGWELIEQGPEHLSGAASWSHAIMFDPVCNHDPLVTLGEVGSRQVP